MAKVKRVFGCSLAVTLLALNAHGFASVALSGNIFKSSG